MSLLLLFRPTTGAVTISPPWNPGGPQPARVHRRDDQWEIDQIRRLDEEEAILLGIAASELW